MKIQYKARKVPGGYEGEFVLPFNPAVVNGGGTTTVKALGTDKASALAKAATAADKLLQNPYAQAIMPPGTAAAVSALKTLSKSAAAGKFASAAKKYSGPAIKRLGKVLGF